MTTTFEWIDSDKRFAQLCASLNEQQAIAIDTEFVRTSTFYPIAGLIQIADPYGIYLIDPLAIKNPEPLAQVFQNPQVVKVIHACLEDLEVFKCFTGVVPVSIFDTQIAAAFAGFGASIGYAKLIESIESVTVPKQETRSNWLQRPLSAAQLKYAALDVEHLLGVYSVLMDTLESKNRLDWVESDCELLTTNFGANSQVDAYFLKIKSAWKLKPRQLAVLQVLCEWREHEARKLDVPRSRVLKDHTLLEIAMSLPKTIEQLARMQDFWRSAIEKYGEHIMALIKQRLNSVEPLPRVLDPPLDGKRMALFKNIKQYIKTIAESLDMPPEWLARKKDIEYIVRSEQKTGQYELPSTLLDWRKEVIGQPLLSYLEQDNEASV